MLYVDLHKKYDSQVARIRSTFRLRIPVVNATIKAAILRDGEKKSLYAMESRILHQVCDPNQSE